MHTPARARHARSCHRAGARAAPGGRLPARGGAPARRREAAGAGAGADHPCRAAHLQPPRRPRLDPRALHPPDAGPRRSRRQAHAGRGAVARGVVDGVGRRPDVHDQAAPGRDLLGRGAAHVRRRRVRVQGGLRPEDREHPRRLAARRRQTTRAVGPGPGHRRREVPVAVRPGDPAARQPADPAAPQAGGRAGRRDARQGLGRVDAAVGDARPRAVRPRALRARPAARLRPEPALLEDRPDGSQAAGARQADAGDRSRPERRDAGAADRAGRLHPDRGAAGGLRRAEARGGRREAVDRGPGRRARRRLVLAEPAPRASRGAVAALAAAAPSCAAPSRTRSTGRRSPTPSSSAPPSRSSGRSPRATSAGSQPACRTRATTSPRRGGCWLRSA